MGNLLAGKFCKRITRNARRPLLISIDGNIGSGKSTLLHLLNDALKMQGEKVRVIPEPVAKWRQIVDSKGENILGAFGKNQPKYAAIFQLTACNSRLEDLQDAYAADKDGKVTTRISERSVYSDMNIFAKTMYDQGHMDEL